MVHGRSIIEESPEPSIDGRREVWVAWHSLDHHLNVVRDCDEGVDVLKLESGPGGGFHVLWFSLIVWFAP